MMWSLIIITWPVHQPTHTRELVTGYWLLVAGCCWLFLPLSLLLFVAATSLFSFPSFPSFPLLLLLLLLLRFDTASSLAYLVLPYQLYLPKAYLPKASLHLSLQASMSLLDFGPAYHETISGRN